MLDRRGRDALGMGGRAGHRQPAQAVAAQQHVQRRQRGARGLPREVAPGRQRARPQARGGDRGDRARGAGVAPSPARPSRRASCRRRAGVRCRRRASARGDRGGETRRRRPARRRPARASRRSRACRPRRRSARASSSGTTGSHIVWSLPRVCSSTSTGPEPRRSYDSTRSRPPAAAPAVIAAEAPPTAVTALTAAGRDAVAPPDARERRRRGRPRPARRATGAPVRPAATRAARRSRVRSRGRRDRAAGSASAVGYAWAPNHVVVSCVGRRDEPHGVGDPRAADECGGGTCFRRHPVALPGRLAVQRGPCRVVGDGHGAVPRGLAEDDLDVGDAARGEPRLAPAQVHAPDALETLVVAAARELVARCRRGSPASAAASRGSAP